MAQNNMAGEQQGIYQIPRDFSGKAASNTVTELKVGQQQPVEENNPIYDTGGIGWGSLSLITFLVIVAGIALVRYMNQQSWREFFARPNARTLEHIQNDRNALKLINAIEALHRKIRTEAES